jgi:hypothetical protein
MAKDKSLIVSNLNAIIKDERLSPSRKLLAVMLKALAKAKTYEDRERFWALILSEYGTGRRTAALVSEEGTPKPIDAQADKEALLEMKEMLAAELSGGERAAIQS